MSSGIGSGWGLLLSVAWLQTLQTLRTLRTLRMPRTPQVSGLSAKQLIHGDNDFRILSISENLDPGSQFIFAPMSFRNTC
ncbi:unnamed protein product [Merluccius merluccius]